MFIHKLYSSEGAFDRQIQRKGRAFVALGGGGRRSSWGILKFRVDRRIHFSHIKGLIFTPTVKVNYRKGETTKLQLGIEFRKKKEKKVYLPFKNLYYQ